MGERLADLHKAREELRGRVRALPVAERVAAVRLLELFERAVEVEEGLDRGSDKLYADYDAKLFAITEKSDAVVEGRQAAVEEDYAFWKTHFDPAFVAPAAPDTPAPVPSFWRRFVQNSGLYAGEFDEPLLDALENLSVFREEEEQAGQKLVVMRVVFRFRPNPFFTNAELSFRLYKEQDDTLLRSRGCPIDWTQNPTLQKEITKKKNKRTGEVRSFSKEVQKPTLFEVFGDFEREEEDAEEEDDEEEPRMTLLGLAEFVDELEDCLPYALEYFLDLHPEEEGETDGEEGGDYPEEGDTPRPVAPAAEGAQPAPAGAAPPEAGGNCKQQ